jgi:CheY-like chemotaxis protein
MISQPRQPVATVLLVEDNDDLRDDLLAELREMDCIATAASDGLAARDMAMQQPFDLILCDVLLPQLDGLQLAEQLRRKEGPNRDTPFLLLSAFSDRQIDQQWKAAGADAYLRKPLDYADLPKIISQYCDSSRHT